MERNVIVYVLGRMHDGELLEFEKSDSLFAANFVGVEVGDSGVLQ